jgi:hypothetical protein
MVGVSDPTRSSNELRAFVQWYWTGSALGTLTTVGFVFSVVWGTGLRLPLPIVISTTLLFGTLDLIGKTPMAQRQTPQRLIRFPNASVRGLVWGFDIGLLWSTRKTSSLIWSGLIVLSLTRPSIGIPAVLATSLVRSCAQTCCFDAIPFEYAYGEISDCFFRLSLHCCCTPYRSTSSVMNDQSARVIVVTTFQHLNWMSRLLVLRRMYNIETEAQNLISGYLWSANVKTRSGIISITAWGLPGVRTRYRQSRFSRSSHPVVEETRRLSPIRMLRLPRPLHLVV